MIIICILVWTYILNIYIVRIYLCMHFMWSYIYTIGGFHLTFYCWVWNYPLIGFIYVWSHVDVDRGSLIIICYLLCTCIQFMRSYIYTFGWFSLHFIVECGIKVVSVWGHVDMESDFIGFICRSSFVDSSCCECNSPSLFMFCFRTVEQLVGGGRPAESLFSLLLYFCCHSHYMKM